MIDERLQTWCSAYFTYFYVTLRVNQLMLTRANTTVYLVFVSKCGHVSDLEKVVKQCLGMVRCTLLPDSWSILLRGAPQLHITGVKYLVMLRTFAIPQIRNISNSETFQQDRAPTHWYRNVRAYLDATFPDAWIVGGGLTA